MRRAIVPLVAILATCPAPGSWAQSFIFNLPPGQIAPFGKDTYQVREPPPTGDASIDDAYKLAKQKATEYCEKMGNAMVIRGDTFSLGSGLFVVFSCVPLGQDAVKR
jgi:hypothetical protein